MQTPIEQQKRVETYWNAQPCDSDRSAQALGTREYFLEIERDRYSHQRHIRRLLAKLDWRGKRVLEIGTGVGTDARCIISLGGIYSGVNVDKGSTEMTARALEVFGVPGSAEQCSATALKFPDESFDIVYSFGVLHHIPEVNAAVSEIHRVLKSGGELLFMIYNRSSINYRIEIMFLRKLFARLIGIPGVIAVLGALGFPRAKLERHRELRRTLGKMSDAEWLNRNTDGPDNPYSCVYNHAEVEAMLSGRFRIVQQEVLFFDARHWGPVGQLLPRGVVEWLGQRWGWHRIVYAKKEG